MTVTQFEKVITKGLKGLGEKELEDVAVYIYFIRKKALLTSELELEFLNEEIKLTNQYETGHLESEFKNYKSIYPKI